MQSKTSWFNGTLFKKNLTRFWPVWVLYLTIWAFIMPIYLLAQLARWEDGYAHYGGALRYFADAYVLNCTAMGVLMAGVFGVLAAMSVFSYLYNNRSAGMLHALPVKREGLFLTNYLSGLTFLALPAVVIFLLTLGAEALLGTVNAGALCMWLVVHLLTILFFYSFAVFCAMFTGHIMALPAFYGVLNLLAFVLWQVVEFILDQFLFGFSYIDWIRETAVWLTPAWGMTSAFDARTEWSAIGDQVLSITYGGLTTALIYGLLGVILAVVALALYRRRQLETAGDVVSYAWVKPVFKYGVGVCAALTLGTLLYGWLGRRGDGGDIWRLFLCLLPSGAVGYFAAEMLLKKSFRAFAHWKGCLVMLAAVALAVGAVRMDVFGYGSKVPRLEEVEYVNFNAGGRTAPYDNGMLGGGEVKDEAYIRAVLDLHAAIIAERNRVQSFDYSEATTGLQITDDIAYETQGRTNVNIDYQLKSGGMVSRNYYVPIEAERLLDSGSYDAKIQGMWAFPDVMMKHYSFYDEPDTTFKLMEAEIELYNTETGEMEPVTLTAEAAAMLRDAVKSDLAAGRLGQRFLLEDAARMSICYYNDIRFYFLDKDSMDAAAAKGVSEKENSSVTTVTVLTTATDTIAALEKLGVTDETHLLRTQEELRGIWNEADARDDTETTTSELG